MKIESITYEDIAKLYSDLQLTPQPTEATKLDFSYIQITNRNFGIRDYTVSSNFSETVEEYATCITDI